jgi:hypothetical protein
MNWFSRVFTTGTLHRNAPLKRPTDLQRLTLQPPPYEPDWTDHVARFLGACIGVSLLGATIALLAARLMGWW